MSIRVTCASCGRRLRAPDHLAGRPVTCPRCGEGMPLPEPPSAEGPARAEAIEWTGPSRLGAVSAAMGLLSVLLLCVPWVGYVAPALSGCGLLVGLWGLLGALRGGGPGPCPPAAAGVARGFGVRAVDLPLAGVVACSLSLALALLPLLFR